MPPPFPYPVPLNAYAGLGNGLMELQGALNYARQPVTMEMTSDGITAANLNTMEWGTAMSYWGPISSVLVYDAPTGGVLLFMALLAGDAVPFTWGNYSAGLYSPTTPPPLVVHMYDRPRVSTSSLTAVGTEGYPLGYGTGGFGLYAYATTSSAEGIANIVILTFAVTSPCSAGTWAPGPYARAA